MSKWSVFGGFGFIGGELCRKYPELSIRIPKHEVVPQTNNVIDFVSTTDNYNVFDSSTLDIETNLLHMMDVLDAAHKKFGKDFTFTLASSWFVYGSGSTLEHPFTEESVCNPRGFYSITKRTAEQLLISYCETFGIKYRILRFANVLGWRDHKASAKKNALQYLIDKLIHNEDIELYDGGNFYRDYVDVRDLVRAIHLSMEDTNPHHILNLSNGVSHRFRDLIDFAAKASGSSSNIWEKIQKPEFHTVVQTKDVFISGDKLKGLGYSPEFTIEQTIQNIIDKEGI